MSTSTPSPSSLSLSPSPPFVGTFSTANVDTPFLSSIFVSLASVLASPWLSPCSSFEVLVPSPSFSSFSVSLLFLIVHSVSSQTATGDSRFTSTVTVVTTTSSPSCVFVCRSSTTPLDSTAGGALDSDLSPSLSFLASSMAGGGLDSDLSPSSSFLASSTAFSLSSVLLSSSSLLLTSGTASGSGL